MSDKWRSSRQIPRIGATVRIPGVTVQYGREHQYFAILAYRLECAEDVESDAMDILPISVKGRDLGKRIETIEPGKWEIEDWTPEA